MPALFTPHAPRVIVSYVAPLFGTLPHSQTMPGTAGLPPMHWNPGSQPVNTGHTRVSHTQEPCSFRIQLPVGPATVPSLQREGTVPGYCPHSSRVQGPLVGDWGGQMVWPQSTWQPLTIVGGPWRQPAGTPMVHVMEGHWGGVGSHLTVAHVVIHWFASGTGWMIRQVWPGTDLIERRTWALTQGGGGPQTGRLGGRSGGGGTGDVGSSVHGAMGGGGGVTLGR